MANFCGRHANKKMNRCVVPIMPDNEKPFFQLRNTQQHLYECNEKRLVKTQLLYNLESVCVQCGITDAKMAREQHSHRIFSAAFFD